MIRMSVMRTAAATPLPPTSSFVPPRRFDSAVDWLHALGDVPLHRIVFDPWPGTATETDLLRFVDRDKRLCELIDGTLVEKPVGYWEAQIAMNLAAVLWAYVARHDLGRVSGPDTTLRMPSSDRVRLPDVVFISKARQPTLAVAVPTLAPDLAVEVLSESNTPGEMNQKMREYFASGTRLAWYVDPIGRTVKVYQSAEAPMAILAEGDVLDGQDVIPGFTLAVKDLFAGVPALG